MCEECENEIEEIKENKKQEKIRDIDLSKLPRKDGVGANKGKQVIDWKNSIGYKVKFIYEDNEGEIEIVDYKIKKHMLYLKYNSKDTFKINTVHFKDCKLGKLLGKVTDEFKIEVGTIFCDKNRDLIIIDREYRKDKKGQNQKWYKYHCNTCGWDEGWVVEHALGKQGIGCSCCANRVVVEHINSIVANEDTHWMIPYFQGGYDKAKLFTEGSHEKIVPICPICGKIKNKTMEIRTISKKHSIGCLYCSDGYSYPSKIMHNIFEQLGVKFETEYSPKWCKYEYKNKLRQGKYDFYFELNNEKYIVEMDGGWHNQDNKMSGQTKIESQEIDNQKDKLADEHGIKVIRIDSDISDLEYIKSNILNSKLNNLFELSIIDWNLAEEFALSNLVKKACNYKKENSNVTTVEIGKIMDLSRYTIIRYLKKGTKLGWCNYDPKEEMKKSCSKNGKLTGKQVEIFKDGISLGIFENCHELDRQSEQLFGIKLIYTAISVMCNNKYPSKFYKGFNFKYVN